MIKFLVFGFVCWFVGIIVGLLIEGSRTTLGTLVINEIDEHTDVYRIEIDNLDDIPKKKRVVLKISNSHK